MRWCDARPMLVQGVGPRERNRAGRDCAEVVGLRRRRCGRRV